MTSPDIISRGFIYLRDSEELMGMIRQYLKQEHVDAATRAEVEHRLTRTQVGDRRWVAAAQTGQQRLLGKLVVLECAVERRPERLADLGGTAATA